MKDLFESENIGNVEIKNRTVMPAMGTNMSDKGVVNKAIINHYRERAKGGVGLIIVEVTCVDTPLGLNTPDMLRIDDDAHIVGHSKLTKEIHSNGAKAFLQLSHTGRGAKPDIIGSQPVSPSDIAMPYSFMMGLKGVKPRKLTIEEIGEIEDKYAQAALRAKKANYDGVEIHCCGYYLCQQFLSSQANNREDEYGGCKENRVRFVLNIITKIKRLCGDHYPIIIKLSLMELGQYKGIKLTEGLYYMHMFQQAGVDAIEVLAGSWNERATKRDRPDTGQSKGLTLPLVSLIRLARVTKKDKVNFFFGKKLASVPLIAGGRTFDPDTINKALAKSEFVFIGRGLLAEPNLVNLIEQDRFGLARPCIGCNQCINEQLQFRNPIKCGGCAVIGYGDNDYSIEMTDKPKNVVVVGAGPAGCEASRIAALRGHTVTLLEATDRIGGQVNLAVIPSYKNNIYPLINYYTNQLRDKGVRIAFEHKASKESLESMNPDVVVFATGTKENILNIEGKEKSIVNHYKEILLGKDIGNCVTVIGGGTIGCEIAELMARHEKKVTIIEMTDTLATKMPKTAQTVLLDHLKYLGVRTYIQSRVLRIEDDHVIIEKDGEELEVHTEAIIMCIGDKPNNELYNECKDSFESVYKIGDCDDIGDIRLAVRSGYVIGSNI